MPTLEIFRWVLFQLLFIRLPSKALAIRKDVGLQVRACRDTVQGRYLLADDSGYVCGALSVDPESRCCPRKGDRYSCHGCNLSSKCCNSYEFCVSCCLNPLLTQKELAVQVKIAKAETAGTYNSVFDFCAGRCRHNSESVVHENAYLSDFHHCFSLPLNSSGSSETLTESKLAGISIVVGRRGESCDSVCKLSGQSCVPSGLLALNQCEIMQKYMNCRGGCLASIGRDQPAEVVDDAPKHLVCIQERAYTQKCRQHLLVMVHISIQEDSAPVFSDGFTLLWHMRIIFALFACGAWCLLPTTWRDCAYVFIGCSFDKAWYSCIHVGFAVISCISIVVMGPEADCQQHGFVRKQLIVTDLIV